MSCVCYNATARCRGRNSVKVESRTFQRGFIWEYARKRPVGCFMTRLERRHFAVQSTPSGRQDNFKLQLQSKAKTTYLFFCFWFFFWGCVNMRWFFQRFQNDNTKPHNSFVRYSTVLWEVTLELIRLHLDHASAVGWPPVKGVQPASLPKLAGISSSLPTIQMSTNNIENGLMD